MTRNTTENTPTKASQFAFVPDPSFKKFFNDFIIRQYGGSLPAFYRALNLSEMTVRRWADSNAPSAKNLALILASELDDDAKHAFAETTLKWVYARQMHCGTHGLSMGPGGGMDTYLALKDLPKDIKTHWTANYHGTAPIAAMADPANRFETILRLYANEEQATFHGLIKTYWEALGRPNYYKFAAVLNTNRNDVERWLDPTNVRLVPLSNSLHAIATSPFINLSHEGTEILSRLVRGRGVAKNDGEMYASLRELQQDYAQQIAATDDAKERDLLARALYKACITFTGYTDYTMAQKTKLSDRRFNDYTSGSNFIGGTGYFNRPKDAFTLAKAFAGDDEALKNDLAANFLNLPEYRDLATIKQRFFESGDRREASIYTRVAHCTAEWQRIPQQPRH